MTGLLVPVHDEKVSLIDTYLFEMQLPLEIECAFTCCTIISKLVNENVRV